MHVRDLNWIGLTESGNVTGRLYSMETDFTTSPIPVPSYGHLSVGSQSRRIRPHHEWPERFGRHVRLERLHHTYPSRLRERGISFQSITERTKRQTSKYRAKLTLLTCLSPACQISVPIRETGEACLPELILISPRNRPLYHTLKVVSLFPREHRSEVPASGV